MCFDRVGYQQPAVTVRRADDVLGVGVTVLRKLLQLLRRFVPFLQRETIIIRHALQILKLVAHVIGVDLLPIILHIRVLEGDFVHADTKIEEGDDLRGLLAGQLGLGVELAIGALEDADSGENINSFLIIDVSGIGESCVADGDDEHGHDQRQHQSE